MQDNVLVASFFLLLFFFINRVKIKGSRKNMGLNVKLVCGEK
jgi:hypothetical protein